MTVDDKEFARITQSFVDLIFRHADNDESDRIGMVAGCAMAASIAAMVAAGVTRDDVIDLAQRCFDNLKPGNDNDRR